MLLYEPPVAVGLVGDLRWLVVEGMTGIMTVEVRSKILFSSAALLWKTPSSLLLVRYPKVLL